MSGEPDEEPELLTDVLFELSPLESVGWTDLLREDAELLVTTAVHLVRDNEFAWRLQVFFQNAPKEQVSTLFDKAAAIRFDWSSRKFQIEKSANWKDISTNPIAAKCLFVALAILRDLSPDLKPRASINSRQKAAHAPADSASIGITGALAMLKRAPEVYPSWPRYFVLRDPETNEAYAGEKETPQRVRLQPDTPFHTLTAEDFRLLEKKELEE